MADSLTFGNKYIISPDVEKKSNDDNSRSKTVISAKSPRYLRKKCIPISQVKKYHSQQDPAGLKMCSTEPHFLMERKTEQIFQSKNINRNNIHDEPYLINTCIENADNSRHFISDQQSFPTLKHSTSLPSLCVETTTTNVLSKSPSCDTLYPHNSETASSELLLSKNIVDSVISTNDAHRTEENSLDTNLLKQTVVENIDSRSRRSSTSTVRERNNSQDSAFSFISIIDVKEAEEAAAAVDVLDAVNNVNTWKPHHSRSKSDATSEISKHEVEDSEVFSLPSSFSNKEPIKKKSIFEGQQMIVPTECFFPRPQQGQSLTSFLSSNEFNISAELDRENAHFCISDALISAIEHMKCSRTLRNVVEVDDESDEEIRNLTQRIRIRRRERQREKVLKSIVLLSDGKTDTTTSQSASPPLSSHSSDFEVESLCSEDEVEDIDLSTHTESNLTSIKENGLSLSMASLYSEADIQKAQMMLQQQESANKKYQESDSVNSTAESIALSLLGKFSEKKLPKASDLQWLVSEQEAPQKLLPLPDSFPVSPDAVEEECNLGNSLNMGILQQFADLKQINIRLRGDMDWAPPRPQIIFNMHPYAKRKAIMEKQKFQCAGCRMKIEKNYISRFRYCDYYGKYFCQCCHSNKLAYIPARILWKWDLSKYYVSNIAWNLLDQMFSDPLFNIEDHNNKLYQKVRQLDLCYYYRTQLFYLKDFMKTCRKADLLQVLLSKQNHHIIFEPHMYSLSDFVKVKSGELSKHLNQIINQCLDHVKQCILCQAKGFICEICQKDSDILFPFQVDKVVLCQSCGACFHKRCCKNVKCPRCIRIQERKKRLAESKSDEDY